MQLTRSEQQDYYILNKKPLNMKDNDFYWFGNEIWKYEKGSHKWRNLNGSPGWNVCGWLTDGQSIFDIFPPLV